MKRAQNSVQKLRLVLNKKLLFEKIFYGSSENHAIRAGLNERESIGTLSRLSVESRLTSFGNENGLPFRFGIRMPGMSNSFLKKRTSFCQLGQRSLAGSCC